MKNKILRNMTTLLLLTLLVAYGTFCVVMYQQNLKNIKEQLAEETRYVAGTVESMGKTYLENLKMDSGYGSKRITLIAEDGSVLFDTDDTAENMENHGERTEILQAKEKGYGEAERYSDTLQKKHLYYAVALDSGQILRLSMTTDSVYGTMQAQFSLVTVLACLLLVVSITAADRLANRMVEPINQLDLRHPLQNNTYEELSPLLIRLEKQNFQIDEQMKNLKARQEEFNTITETMQEGLILLNHHLQVLSMNSSAKRILGVSEEQFERMEKKNEESPLYQEGLPLHILTLNRSQELLKAVRTAQTGQSGHCMMEHEGRQYSLLASPVNPGDVNGGVVIFMLDITEQAEAERIRREFSANVSHELKTPLTAISGYAEIMENGLVKPEDMNCFAGRIHKEAMRMIRLVEDIIQLSRLDENQEEWQKEPVELESLCQEIAGRLVTQAEKKNVSIQVTGEKTTVVGIRHLLDEMIYNLCDNAIKYNKDGGQVWIRVNSDTPCIVVEDTGIGIPKEHHSRIFERFYRVDKSHSRETGGTGLGLSIVKHTAAVHGAQIQLESEVGKGTKITVTFAAQ